MTDKKKTKKQLIEELEELRRQLKKDDGGKGDRSEEPSSEPTGLEITRRTVLKMAWATPVILSIPLRPRAVSGQPLGTVAPGCPTMSPTRSPTTARPTRTPTLFPTTAEPSPATMQPTTMHPSKSPTQSPTNSPTTMQPTTTMHPSKSPTQSPTNSPTTMQPTTTMHPTKSPTAALVGRNDSAAFPTVAPRAFPAAAPVARVETALFDFDD